MSDEITQADLKPAPKMLLGLIHGLCKKNGTCVASNAYLAKAIGLSERQIQRHIRSLIQEGYIESKGNTNSRQLTTLVSLNSRQECRKLHPTHDVDVVPLTTKVSQTHDIDVVHNIKNNKEEDKGSSADASPDTPIRNTLDGCRLRTEDEIFERVMVNREVLKLSKDDIKSLMAKHKLRIWQIDYLWDDAQQWLIDKKTRKKDHKRFMDNWIKNAFKYGELEVVTDEMLI